MLVTFVKSASTVAASMFKISVPSPPAKVSAEVRLVPTVNVSLPALPLMLSVPAATVMMSLPSPPVTVSLPAPPVRMSLPAPPVTMSLPASPSRVSIPLPPVMVSAPSPPVRISSPAPPVISKVVVVVALLEPSTVRSSSASVTIDPSTVNV